MEGAEEVLIPKEGKKASGIHEVAEGNSSIIPPIPESLKYNGSNYEEWANVVEMTLKSKGLSDHLTTELKPSDPNLKKWYLDDATVYVFLLGSLNKDQIPKVKFMKKPKAIWEFLEKISPKKSTLYKLIELGDKALNLRQGNRTVTEYVEELRQVWTELDYILPIEGTNQWKHTHTMRMVKFLLGLNPEYDSSEPDFE